MKFDSTKSMSRNRPPNGPADLDRSRVSGWSRSPLPPAMIIARTRARRGMRSSLPGRAQAPGRLEVGEAEVLALEPAQRVRVVGGERRTRGEPARHLGQ